MKKDPSHSMATTFILCVPVEATQKAIQPSAIRYQDSDYMILTLPAQDTRIAELLQTPLSVAWSSRPDLLTALCTIAEELSINQLMIPAQRSTPDLEALIRALQESGIQVDQRYIQSATQQDYFDEDDSDEVAKRLRDLGYL
jgi:hypothetical protein